MWKNSSSKLRNRCGGLCRPIRGLQAIGIGLAGLAVLLTIGLGSSSAQETAAPPETQTLHVLAGKSVVINLEARLQRVLVSNPAVIQVVTTSPRQVVVSARGVGASSLILWDESGRSRLLDVLADLDVTALRDGIQMAFPSEPIQVQAEGDRLIVSGQASGQEVIDSVLKMTDVLSKNIVNSMTLAAPPHEKQILLEVKFAEIDRTKLDQLGLNLLSTGLTNTPGALSTQQFSGPALGGGHIQGTIGALLPGTTTSFTINDILNIFLFRPDINLGATIRALQQKSVLQILAEPNLLAMNGKPARFLAGGEFPFPVVQGGTNFTAVTIQFRPFGVRLEFTGFITKENAIRLQVSPEVSTLDFTNALSIAGFLVPAISTRRAETEVELKDGQSFGIAGLLDQRTQAQLNKIRGIGEIPILGELFRSKSINRSRTELLVLVTPRITDPTRTPLPQPAAPKTVVPNLNPSEFDRHLPKGEGVAKPPAKSPQK